VFVKNIDDCVEFIANDGCQIREWLHPKNDAVDLPYSIAMGTVAIGQKTYKHKLEQAEVYLITAGQGLMHIDEEEKQVKIGDAIYVEASCSQWITNSGKEPLSFTVIVSPPWSEAGDNRLD